MDHQIYYRIKIDDDENVIPQYRQLYGAGLDDVSQEEVDRLYRQDSMLTLGERQRVYLAAWSRQREIDGHPIDPVWSRERVLALAEEVDAKWQRVRARNTRFVADPNDEFSEAFALELIEPEDLAAD